MKQFKHIETGHIITEYNPNHYSIYERMGYEEVVQQSEEVKPKRKKKSE